MAETKHSYTDQAEIAAVLESHFREILDAKTFSTLDDIDSRLSGFEVVDNRTTFYRGETGECYKAITVRDSQGNYYVHYNGTGDGNWPYNAVAYGPQDGKTTSAIQDWSVDYFDGIYNEYCSNDPDAKIYVSGHSQGGNNAQFVTVRSQYGDHIEACISLDGPGFSNQSVEETKALYGEEHFAQQQNKIYAFNGEFDYVSCLGQEQIVLNDPEHTTYVSYDLENNGLNFAWFHAWNGLVHSRQNGEENYLLNGLQPDYSNFRKFVLEFNNRITQLPQEKQQEAALLMMKLCENLMGNETTGENLTVAFTPEEFEQLKETLIPIIVDIGEKEPDLIRSTLEELGLKPIYTDLIMSVLSGFNDLDPETRIAALEALAGIITIDKNGNIKIDIDGLVHTIRDLLLNHPEELQVVLGRLGDFIVDHPVETVALSLLSVFLLPVLIQLGVDAFIIVEALDKLYHAASQLAGKIKTFVLNTMSAIKDTLSKIKALYDSIFNKGSKYASAHPYIKVDTVQLRSYAARIANVNRRLRSLDSNMRTLYWQVGFLDLWDILVANLITSESYTLGRVQSYLNDAGDTFDTAESTAGGYIG